MTKKSKSNGPKLPVADEDDARMPTLSSLNKLLDASPFLAYSPFLTYSEPKNEVFLSHSGQPVHRNPGSSDAEALWRIGREAYDLISVNDFEDFASQYGEFARGIRDLKQWLLKALEEGNVRGPDGGRLTPEDLALDGRSEAEVLAMADPLPTGSKRGELLAFACLREIDNALIAMDLGERSAVTAAIQAAHTLADAQAFIGGNESFRRVRSQMAYEAAMARHRRDPKQADKKFVSECYRQWRAKPGMYRTKAAFARDMLEKCEHLESQKKIEDWVREWDAASP